MDQKSSHRISRIMNTAFVCSCFALWLNYLDSDNSCIISLLSLSVFVLSAVKQSIEKYLINAGVTI